MCFVLIVIYICNSYTMAARLNLPVLTTSLPIGSSLSVTADLTDMGFFRSWKGSVSKNWQKLLSSAVVHALSSCRLCSYETDQIANGEPVLASTNRNQKSVSALIQPWRARPKHQSGANLSTLHHSHDLELFCSTSMPSSLLPLVWGKRGFVSGKNYIEAFRWFITW